VEASVGGPERAAERALSKEPRRPILDRAAAASIDAGGVLVLAVVFAVIAQTRGPLAGPAVVAVLLAPWAYALLCLPLLRQGCTLGKRMLDLRVDVVATGEPAGIGRMLLRETVAKSVTNPLGIPVGFLIGLLRRDRRCGHDLLVGTAVRRRSVGAAAIPGRR